MIFGQAIPPNTTVLGPWSQRGADNGVYAYQALGSAEWDDFTVTVLHKNREDGDKGSDASVTFAKTGTGIDIAEGVATGLEELVRIQVQNTTNDTLLWRGLGWVWFDTPNA